MKISCHPIPQIALLQQMLYLPVQAMSQALYQVPEKMTTQMLYQMPEKPMSQMLYQNASDDAVPSSSYATAQQPGEVLQLHTPLFPEHTRPFTKAAPRKQKQVGRRAGKTRILTDTPEKTELEILAEKRNKKMPTSKKRKLATSKQQKSTSAKRMREPEEHESESESAAIHFTSEKELSDDEGEEYEESLVQDVTENDYVLVRFLAKKSRKFFVGQVVTLPSDGEVEIKFMKRTGLKKHSTYAFTFPDNDDIATHNKFYLLQPGALFRPIVLAK